MVESLKVNIEYEFLENYQILSVEEIVKLKECRASVNEKLANHVIGQKELLDQIKVELNLFQSCKDKVISLEKHQDVIESQTLYLIANCITCLFNHMHLIFTIEKEVLFHFIEFCLENVTFFNVNQLIMLVDAVQYIKDSQYIWVKLLELYIELGNYQKMLYVFKEGVHSLKAESFPLWLMMVEKIGDKRPDMMEKLFEEGSCSLYTNISLEIRPKYLEWCKEHKGIDETRDLFLKLKDLKPPSIKLYDTMISIECMQTNIKTENARQLFDELCSIFGKDNTDVWIDYIRFEHTYGSQKLMGTICSKALWSLESNLKDIMVDKFNKLKNELKKDLNNEVIVIDDD